MRITITGAKGQLGQALQEVFSQEQLFLVDLPELDLRQNQATGDHFQKVQPELVIHCAAQTAVDLCEVDPEAAYTANVIATANVVRCCKQFDVPLVYLSTDYVFDGTNHQPYRESDPPQPINVYGHTKWQGEQLVSQELTRFYIVRTAWLFGDRGSNFVRTILQRALAREPLRVVTDQIGSPTYAIDLAGAIGELIKTKIYGIYHITNQGSCSWYQFAQEIITQAGLSGITLEPITTAALGRPAPRPAYSVLGQEALLALGIEMPSYQDALGRFLKRNGSNISANLKR